MWRKLNKASGPVTVLIASLAFITAAAGTAVAAATVVNIGDPVYPSQKARVNAQGRVYAQVWGGVNATTTDTTKVLWRGTICGDPSNGGNYGTPAINVAAYRTIRLTFTQITAAGTDTIDLDTADDGQSYFAVIKQMSVGGHYSESFDVPATKISLFCELGRAPSRVYVTVYGRA